MRAADTGDRLEFGQRMANALRRAMAVEDMRTGGAKARWRLLHAVDLWLLIVDGADPTETDTVARCTTPSSAFPMPKASTIRALARLLAVIADELEAGRHGRP